MLEYDVGVGLPERRKPRTPTGTENRRDAVELLLLEALLSDAAPPRNRDDTGDPGIDILQMWDPGRDAACQRK